MKAGWKNKPLGELCDVIGGGTPPKDRPDYYGGNIPWATVRDMRADIITSTEHSITSEAVKASATNIIPAGNVVIATRVGLGKVCLLAQDTAVNQDLRGIVPKSNKEIDIAFLFAWFKSISEQIIAEGTGATVQGVKLPFIKGLSVPVPTMEEQRRIVTLLDEAFADIATAKANAEKNLQNARELFDSALNAIEGKKEQLGSYVTIKTGKLDANAAVIDGEYPFFTCSREIFAIDTFAFDCEAILLAGNNAVGDFNVKHYSGKFNAYQRTYVITIQDEEILRYRYLYFQMLKSLKKFKEQSVGSSTKFLKLGMIKELEITLPPIQEQDRQLKLLSGLLDQVEALESIYRQKLTALDNLKKSLLHQAFSGQL